MVHKTIPSLLASTLHYGFSFGPLPFIVTNKSARCLRSQLVRLNTSHKTVQSVLDNAVQDLERHGVPEPFESAMNLVAKAMDLPWETGYRDLSNRHPELLLQKVTDSQAATLDVLLERRRQHEPIQYILGQWDFMGYMIQVRPPLLCPRPETEELVELVLNDNMVQRNNKEILRILDVGCGTGCIGIALADKLPNARVDAIDIEPVAVATANANAGLILRGKRNKYRAMLASALDYAPSKTALYDLIISNPPYIPSGEMKTLERVVTDYESHSALDGGLDGYGRNRNTSIR